MNYIERKTNQTQQESKKPIIVSVEKITEGLVSHYLDKGFKEVTAKAEATRATNRLVRFFREELPEGYITKKGITQQGNALLKGVENQRELNKRIMEIWVDHGEPRSYTVEQIGNQTLTIIKGILDLQE